MALFVWQRSGNVIKAGTAVSGTPALQLLCPILKPSDGTFDVGATEAQWQRANAEGIALFSRSKLLQWRPKCAVHALECTPLLPQTGLRRECAVAFDLLCIALQDWRGGQLLSHAALQAVARRVDAPLEAVLVAWTLAQSNVSGLAIRTCQTSAGKNCALLDKALAGLQLKLDFQHLAALSTLQEKHRQSARTISQVSADNVSGKPHFLAQEWDEVPVDAATELPLPGAVLCDVADVPAHGTFGINFNDHSPRDGHPVHMFLFRTSENQLRGFVNRCPHADVPLDNGSGHFLHTDKVNFRCSKHGALFRTDNGLCVSGPCEGKSLVAVPLTEDSVRQKIIVAGTF